jgi:molybdopterin converting factor small subunit
MRRIHHLMSAAFLFPVVHGGGDSVAQRDARNVNYWRYREMATVLVPTPLRRLTGGQSKVTVDASDIQGVIDGLENLYPGVADKLLDANGEIKRFINVFVDESEIRTLQGRATQVDADAKVSIVPAMAGGQ